MKELKILLSNPIVVTSIFILVGVCVVVLAFKHYFGKKFNDQIINFISKAQYGKLQGKEALVRVIRKFRSGTLDERMVQVIAEAIDRIPIANLIYTVFPKNKVISFLYNKSQSLFDEVEVALKAHKRFGLSTVEEISSKVLTPEDFFEIKNADLEKGLQALIEVAPSIKNITPLLEKAPDIIELLKILNNPLPEDYNE